MAEVQTSQPIDEKRGPQPENFLWYPDLAGKTLIVVASGPSARDVPLNITRGDPEIYTIAINESWKLCPWAQMLYGCDHQWWWRRRGDWKGFGGIKVTQDRQAADLMPGEDIKRVFSVRGCEHLMLDQKGYIGWGGNSGFQALNLGMHFKPRKVILVGFDMTLKNGDHWHGRHANGLHNPKPPYVNRWRRVTDLAYLTLRSKGVFGYNTSPESALRNWPKATLEQALNDDGSLCAQEGADVQRDVGAPAEACG